jgi:hypothetical protein
MTFWDLDKMVAGNLYQSTTLGRLPQTKFKAIDDEKYAGGAIFDDIASISPRLRFPKASTDACFTK